MEFCKVADLYLLSVELGIFIHIYDSKSIS